MGKKTSNPADAYREFSCLDHQTPCPATLAPTDWTGKQQRAKEVKKNKEVRQKVRDAQNVRKDTRRKPLEQSAIRRS